MNTAYFLDCVAGNLFGTKADPAMPTDYYIGLSTTAPSADGKSVSEPSGNGYARIKLENLSAPNNGIVTNNLAIDFPESVGGSWGTVTHFVIYDSLTGGNLLMYGALSAPRSIETATIMTIKAGNLRLSIQNPN